MTDGRWGWTHQTPLGAGEAAMGRGWVMEQGFSFFFCTPFTAAGPSGASGRTRRRAMLQSELGSRRDAGSKSVSSVQTPLCNQGSHVKHQQMFY